MARSSKVATGIDIVGSTYRYRADGQQEWTYELGITLLSVFSFFNLFMLFLGSFFYEGPKDFYKKEKATFVILVVTLVAMLSGLGYLVYAYIESEQT